MDHLEKQNLFAGKDMTNMTLIDLTDELNARGDGQINRGRRWTNSKGKEDYIR